MKNQILPLPRSANRPEFNPDSCPPTCPPPSRQTIPTALQEQDKCCSELFTIIEKLEQRLGPVLDCAPDDPSKGACDPAPANVVASIYTTNRFINRMTSRISNITERLQL